MIKEVRLPFDAEVGGCPPFPLADRIADFPVSGKREQRVTVVGHQEENMRIPMALLMPEFHGIQELFRDGMDGELVRALGRRRP